jgi:hypothetical protein
MSMFCFQCEQTAGGTGCTKTGVCGKTPEASNLQDDITAAMITLARAVDGKPADPKVEALFMDALFMTVTNVNFDPAGPFRDARPHPARGRGRRRRELLPPRRPLPRRPDVVSLRSTLLFGLRGMAAYAHHARVLGKTDPKVSAWFQKGMKALGDDHTVEEWLGLIMEFGQINLECMALLDAANTGAYGHPEPTRVVHHAGQGPLHHRHRPRPARPQDAARAVRGQGRQHLHPRRNAPRPGLSRTEEAQAPQGPLRHRLAEPAEGIRRPPRRRALHHQLHHAPAPDLHPAPRHHGRSRLARRPAHRRR